MNKIIISLIFLITAVTITGIVLLGVDKSVDHICSEYAKSYQTCVSETR